MDEKNLRLMEITGDGGFLTKPELKASLSSVHILIKPFPSCFIVKPKNVDEVQKIVLRANENQTPLIPVSSGEPHFRGDTDPSTLESVIVDLSEMKHILKINQRNRLTPIEPLRSLEIVWGNGNKFYNGSGTFRCEKDEDWQVGWPRSCRMNNIPREGKCFGQIMTEQNNFQERRSGTCRKN